MAAAPTRVSGALASATSVSTGATGTCEPTAGSVVDIIIGNTFGGAANQPTISGGTGWASGLTWELIAGSDNAANRCTVYRATVPGSTSPGVVQIAFGGQTQAGYVVDMIQRVGTTEAQLSQGDGFGNSGAASATLEDVPPDSANTQVTATYYVATGTMTPTDSESELFEETVFGAAKLHVMYDTSADSDGVAGITLGTAGNWASVTWEYEDAGATPSVALTGTIASGATESDIVNGGETAILTLTDDTWVAAGATFNAQRQAIIDGFDAASSPTNGWNNEVRDKAAVTEVVRTSDTVVTVTFAAQAGYSIDSAETITVTVPASALVTSASPVEADSTFQIAADAGGSSGTTRQTVAPSNDAVLPHGIVST